MRSAHLTVATSCLVILAACTSEKDSTGQDPLLPGVSPSASNETSGGSTSGASSNNGTLTGGNTAPGAQTGATGTVSPGTGGTNTGGATGGTNGGDTDVTETPTVVDPGTTGGNDSTSGQTEPSSSTNPDATDGTGPGSTSDESDNVETMTSDGDTTGGESDPGASTGEDTTSGTGETSDEPDMEETCPLPTTFRWTSTGPIAQPRAGWASIKDFTAVIHEDQYIVYMTNHDTGTSWGAAMFMFDDWSQAGTATQHPMSRTSVAPTLFYFAPKDVWVLAYQWGSTSFSYATSNDPTDPGSWSAEQNLYNYTGSLPNSGTGPIDQHVICDDTDCYLFFNGDNGEIYRSSMPIEDFPGTFGPHETIMSRTTNELFEAVAVYSIKGSDQYLMLMESIGSNGRYFSAFTSNDLGGEWTDLKTRENDPFAGRVNVTFEGNAWTTDISHGDIVRRNPDQTMEIDPCHMELLYQGRDPGINTEYGLLPYRPGVLTLER